ncbi:MAG: cytidylate kinase-like family protein [Bacteroidales bacterium]|jgi:cytidylate kinase|nr:cytidylate kinase-like family protein [Bacteroidales bacterium]NLK80286.1 cytidylate kinase-like family protein [Bacteroidales bacterium]HKM31690.1 cytidylate kinase-like family protein [Bacteroidales bacterium]HPX79048.1 cytidylate kinase-like family protein [Bacteroidales bacterium]HQB23714.1 cytidylate kinase-like family protein [Bacteroidales bacterium]
MKPKANITITLGRQLGSGGYTVGKMIASALGLSFFDKELLYYAAKESGLCEEVFENADEKTSTGISRILSAQNMFGLTFFDPMNTPLSRDRIFNIQSEVIRKLADEQSCLFIGRCADYILRDNPNMRSFFIHAPLSVRVENVSKRQEIPLQEAEQFIAREEKKRASYYNYFTNKEWGKADSYHFTLDAGLLGLEGCAKAAVELIKKSY